MPKADDKGLVSRASVLDAIEDMPWSGNLADRHELLSIIRALPSDAGQCKVERLRDALKWYEERVSLCNNFTQKGHDARGALARDRGNRARAALKEPDQC